MFGPCGQQNPGAHQTPCCPKESTSASEVAAQEVEAGRDNLPRDTLEDHHNSMEQGAYVETPTGTDKQTASTGSETTTDLTQNSGM